MSGVTLKRTTNRYTIEGKIDISQAWDAICKKFIPLGNKGEFVKGDFDDHTRRRHSAQFERFDANRYEVSLYDSCGTESMEITTLRGDLGYAQKDIADIAEAINQIANKDTEPPKLLRTT